MKKTILFFLGLAFLTFKNQAQTVIDVDGNVYNTVTIGTQVWMKENLKTTKYRDNTPIPNITDNTQWGNLTTDARCYYNNDSATNAPEYGVLYNWYVAVDNHNICPLGWHVPTDSEWTTLITYLGGPNVAGDKLKESGSTHWQSPNEGATNETGFTALPGGVRNNVGAFININTNGFWWSTTVYDPGLNSWGRQMYYDRKSVYSSTFFIKFGFSIRCVKNSSAQINEINNRDEILIYPNPTLDKVFIDCSERQNMNMQVYNIIGDCVFQSTLQSGINEIDIASLKKGIYVISLIGVDETFQKKLIKN